MADAIDLEKQRIRAGIRARRRARDDASRSAARDALTERLRELVLEHGARSVSCYLPVGGEPDTTGFLAWAEQEGIETLLPSAREDGLLDWIRPSGDGFVTGAFGIPEPLGEILSPLAVGEVGLMLIPAAAVDRRGVRLGWGKGYFDRSLGSMGARPPVFAIVHDDEVLESLPSDSHDVPVAGFVTPQRVVRIER